MERKKCLKAGRGRRICKNGRCSEISEGERLLSEGERGTMGRVNLGMRVLREREKYSTEIFENMYQGIVV